MYLDRYLDKKVMILFSGCPRMIGTFVDPHGTGYRLIDIEEGPEGFSSLYINDDLIVAIGYADVAEEDE